jgi:hypothetical protein
MMMKQKKIINNCQQVVVQEYTLNLKYKTLVILIYYYEIY